MASDPVEPARAGPTADQPGQSSQPHLRPSAPTAGAPGTPHLERRIGLASAVTLNMMYMIGVGPFITLPLIVAAMGGSQALLGWLLGAAIAACDGLVWAELGAAMPEAGGSYAFLQGDLRTRGRRPLRLVPLHLSAWVQRAPVDRLRLHWICGVRLLFASRTS